MSSSEVHRHNEWIDVELLLRLIGSRRFSLVNTLAIISPTSLLMLTLYAHSYCNSSEAYKPAVVDAEYEKKVKALSQMLTKTKDELDQVRQLADELKGVKLASPPSGSVESESGAMKGALAAARSATEEFGKDSTEAKLAWETVEEIAASAGDSEAYHAPLDEECLIELIEGCEALEKFGEALEKFN